MKVAVATYVSAVIETMRGLSLVDLDTVTKQPWTIFLNTANNISNMLVE